tara:strand:- start:171 stop:974 length:804 start_codon:yes stop_codon:yes gene_type:complete
MFSIYSSAFNLVKNNFDYKEAIDNFCNFAEEVVIAVNTSEDNTLETLQELSSEYDNLKIISTDLSYEDPLVDGKIKNEALQATTQEFKIGLDMDERIPSYAKYWWVNLASNLRFSNTNGYLIPSINLWGDKESIRWDNKENVKFKWYLHKGGFYRGTHKQAIKEDGHVDIEKSDTCDLIDSEGNLVQCEHYFDSAVDNLEKYREFLKSNPVYVFHMGCLDFDKKVELNKNFWKKHWETEAGREVANVVTDKKEFQKFQTQKHGLELW